MGGWLRGKALAGGVGELLMGSEGGMLWHHSRRTGFIRSSAHRPVNALGSPSTKETSTIQAANSSYPPVRSACSSLWLPCPPTAASLALDGQEVRLMRQMLLVPHGVAFPGQAGPLPAAV